MLLCGLTKLLDKIALTKEGGNNFLFSYIGRLITMKNITNIAVFDNDKYFLAMLKGYCYANNITVAKFDFNSGEINEAEKLKPVLFVVPVDWVNTTSKRLETALLKQMHTSGEVKICAINRSPSDILSVGLLECVDVIIHNPSDIGEIDDYLKKHI